MQITLGDEMKKKLKVQLKTDHFASGQFNNG